MKKIIIAILLLSIMFASCEKLQESDLESNKDIVAIAYGSSFGFCDGYCNLSLKLTSEELVIVKESNKPEDYPKIIQSFSIKPEIFLELKKKMDFIVFRNLDEIIGCPDCADGGAEWVEIETCNLQHKVTFEYDNEPLEISNLVKDLRSLAIKYLIN